MLRSPVLGTLCALAAIAFAACDARAEGPTLGAAAAVSGRYFGAAIAVDALDEKPYRAQVGAELTSVTPENAMKWGEIEPVRGVFAWRLADTLAAFAQAHGQKIRGHNLVWHAQLPAWLTGGKFAPDEVKGLMLEHISTEMGRFKGAISAWDVVNEPFTENGGWRESVFYTAMGPDYISLALNAARKADPDAKLYINEYGVESAGPKMEALYRLIASLKAKGVPIDGVGMQCHFVSGGAPRDLQDVMGRFASLGVDVAVTELDLRIHLPATVEDLERQAADFGRVASACVNTKRCVGVTTWGLTDDYSWIPGWFSGFGAALPFDESYRAKPAVAAIVKAFAAPAP